MFRLKKGKRLKCAIAFNDCNFVTKNLEIFKNHLQCCSNEKLQDKSMTLKLDFFSNLIKANLAETPVGKLKTDQNTFQNASIQIKIIMTQPHFVYLKIPQFGLFL